MPICITLATSLGITSDTTTPGRVHQRTWPRAAAFPGFERLCEPDRGRSRSASHYDRTGPTRPLVGKACPRSQAQRLDSRPFRNGFLRPRCSPTRQRFSRHRLATRKFRPYGCKSQSSVLAEFLQSSHQIHRARRPRIGRWPIHKLAKHLWIWDFQRMGFQA